MSAVGGLVDSALRTAPEQLQGDSRVAAGSCGQFFAVVLDACLFAAFDWFFHLLEACG